MQAAAAARGHYGSGSSSSSSSSSLAAAAATSHANVRMSPPLIRRAASESMSGTPPHSNDAATRLRFTNTAGRGLTHIPRRDRTRSGQHIQHQRNPSGAEEAKAGDKESMGDTAIMGAGVENKDTNTHVRGRRGRLHFVLGSGESSDEHEEGLDKTRDEDEGNSGRNGNRKQSEEERSVETCAARKRPVSAERSRVLHLKKKIVFNGEEDVGTVSIGEGQMKNSDGTGRVVDEDGSGSECATPTPRSVARGRRVRARVVGEEDQAMPSTSDANVKNIDVKNTTLQAPSPSVRTHRGRGRRRSMFDDEDFEEDETSTIA